MPAGLVECKSCVEFPMFSVRGRGEGLDVLRTAMQYLKHLKAELAKVDAFLITGHELSRLSVYAGPDFGLDSDIVAPQGFALGVDLKH